MPFELEKLHDLTPGVDKFPAHYIPVIRDGLNREITGPGVTSDIRGATVVPFIGAVTKFRWGKLDGTLSAGSYATVSLWQGTNKSWGEWDQDSGDNWDTVYAPPLLSSGSIASGKWVLVGIINGRKVVLLAEC